MKAPSPPYLGPAKFHGGAINKPIRRVVIHCTVSPTVAGGARSIAKYFRGAVTRPSSAHYVVDPTEVVQVVYDGVVAYHAPPNDGSLGIELCDPQTGSVARWAGASHVAMLKRAAYLTAQLCLAYDVPVKRLTPADARRGAHGIMGHVDVSHAWGQTTHTDPGVGFPWDLFMGMVHAAASDLTQGTAPVPVNPVKKPTPVKPVGPTRVETAHEKLANAISLLKLAVADGRTGSVKVALDALIKANGMLPQK